MRGIQLFFAIAVCLAAASTLPAAGDILTPEIVIDLDLVREVQMSPDGERVAYILDVPRSEDEEPGRSHRELWILPARGGSPTRYVAGPGRCSSPVWSPDGARIAFVSSRNDEDKTAQIWVIPTDVGEAVKVTDLKSSASRPRWSPDGSSIAFLSADPKSDEEKEREDAGEDWELVDQDYRHHRLRVADLASQEVRTVTESDLTVWSFCWSPDGKQFAVTASPTPRTDDFYMFQQLYTVPSSGGELEQLCRTEGKLGAPQWSPDGKWIANLGAVDISDPRAGCVFLTSLETGERKNLTPELPGTAEWLGWTGKKEIAFVATMRTRSTLNLINIRNSKILQVHTSPCVFGSASFAKKGKTFALAASTPFIPAEVFTGDIKSQVTRLTFHNSEIADVELGEQEAIHWTASDGWEIWGLLLKPVGYKEGRRYPLVVQVHGGPESAYLNGWNTRYSRWTQMLAARGYLVFMPNYRGSTGRGIEFLKGDHRDLAGKEFQDVLDGIDYLVAEGLADPDRVGIGGGSYGGYFSAWAATRYSDRFRAAIVFAGITNWISFMGTTDIPAENALVHWDLWCYDDPDTCWERSPLAHVMKAHTATLIAHGENDLRVPVSQSWELYQALRVRGLEELEYVVYPREPHGLLERAHKIDFMNRALDWYDTYLK